MCLQRNLLSFLTIVISVGFSDFWHRSYFALPPSSTVIDIVIGHFTMWLQTVFVKTDIQIYKIKYSKMC